MTEDQKRKLLVSLKKVRGGMTRECLNPEQKQKMSKLLTYFKKMTKEDVTGNMGGETDIPADGNLAVSENEFTSGESKPEPKVVAKMFDTNADFDSYVNQRRGIEMTPKELQAIGNYQEARPTQQDRFFVRFENSDGFGNNDTTVIKKLREGGQFCWTAFTKHQSADDEGQPEGGEEEKEMKEQGEPSQDVTVDDPMRITKSITFTDETQGSDILANFLQSLDI